MLGACSVLVAMEADLKEMQILELLLELLQRQVWLPIQDCSYTNKLWSPDLSSEKEIGSFVIHEIN
jgi:hypothetical protein